VFFLSVFEKNTLGSLDPMTTRHLSAALMAGLAAGFLATAQPALAENQGAAAGTAVVVEKAAPAALLPPSPEGAAEILRQIDAVIALSIAPYGKDAAYHWTEGQPSAVPAGDGYDVTVPGLNMTFPKDAGMTMGPMSFRVVPQADGTLSLEGTPPTIFSHRDPEFGEIAGSFADGHFSGVWSPEYQIFYNFDLKATDGKATVGDDKDTVTVGTLTMHQAPADDESGPVRSLISALTVEKITFADAAGLSQASLDKAAMKASVLRFDLTKLAAFRELTAHAQPEALKEDEILAAMTKMFGGFEVNLAANGLRVHVPEEKEDVSIEKAGLTVGADGFDKPFADMRFLLSAAGVAGPIPADLKALVPEDAAVSVAFDHLPSDALSSLEKSSDHGEEVLDGDDFADALLPVLQKAGSKIVVDGTHIDSPKAAVSAIGGVGFVPGAVHGVAGKVTVSMRGIKAVIEELKKRPGGMSRSDAIEAQGMLSVLQMMGQQEKDDQGRDVRVFNIELKKDGKLMMNGTDMSMLANMMNGGANSEEDDEGVDPMPEKGPMPKN